MTSPKERLERISFSDGRPIGLSYDGETLLLRYQNWQEKIITLKFTGVAYFACYGASGSLCEAHILEDSPMVEDVKKKLQSDWGSAEAWRDTKLTELRIVDDLPLVQVIFEDWELVDPSESICEQGSEGDAVNRAP
jgi:hypothetical protein